MLWYISTHLAFAGEIVVHYGFDNSDDDESGNGHTLVRRDGASFDTTRQCGSRSLRLNNNNGGDHEHAELPTAAVAGLTDFSVSAWVRTDSTNPDNWERVFDFGDEATQQGNYLVTVRNDQGHNKVASAIQQETPTPQILERSDNSCPFASGTWQHTAFAYSATDGWAFYVDGVQCGSGTGTIATLGSLQSTLGTNLKLYLGRSNWEADAYLDGRLDEFRLYDFPLSQTQVTQLSGQTLGCNGLTEDLDDDGLFDDDPNDVCTGLSNVDLDGDGWCDDLDCDDADLEVNPEAIEIPGNAVDEDCDGFLACYLDADGDGYGDATGTTSESDTTCTAGGFSTSADDCDDDLPGVNPGAPELVADGIDQDCTGFDRCYADGDDDGYGSGTVEDDGDGSCDDAGEAAMDGDCDDAEAAVHPGAEELCNDVDDDCDGNIDLDATDRPLWYPDGDSDGYADANGAPPTAQCDAPGAAWTTAIGDCDDGNAGVSPAVTETCNQIDDDCDGDVDEGFSVQSWYVDADEDGYGSDQLPAVEACAQPAGHVTERGDCNDAAPTINPSANEVAGNGVDEDCSGDVACFVDQDGDGQGRATTLTDLNDNRLCTDPGESETSSDCNDDDGDVFVGAPELCNDADDDCDGQIDEGLTILDSYPDGDGDGRAAVGATAVQDCEIPEGHVTVVDDCDDTRADIFPGAPELCDTVDNDCDTQTDEDGDTPWFLDADGDGYGDQSGIPLVACNQPTDRVGNAEDCDDTDAAVYPGAPEACDLVDQNCNGQIDDNSTGFVPGTPLLERFVDGDGDGEGSGAAETFCASQVPTTGYATTDTDCDDTNGAVNTQATEDCATVGVDDDCDNQADEATSDPADLSNATTYFLDSDADTWGGPTQIFACTLLDGFAARGGDCRDDVPDIHPDAQEVCDGTDNDCDTLVDDDDPTLQALHFLRDTDGDGYGTPLDACDTPPDLTDIPGDCDDTDPTVFPSAPQICDGRDHDCDGMVDGELRWTDADDDGWGAGPALDDCDVDGVGREGDCDDSDPAVNPDATELPGNGVDDDCDGVDDLLPGDTAHTGDTGRPPGGPVSLPTVDGGCACDQGGSPGFLLGLVGLLALRRRAA